jgi:hypothetical protein
MAAPTHHAAHPIRQLITLLPRLAQTASAQPDFDASDPALLVQIAEACELLQRVTSLGISAIGQLLAHAAAEVDSGEVGQDAIEALGWVLSDMADAAAACLQLAAPCRRATVDFTGARDGKAQ